MSLNDKEYFDNLLKESQTTDIEDLRQRISHIEKYICEINERDEK